MPRPLSQSSMASATYDPYSYYPSRAPSSSPSHSLTLANKFALEHFVQSLKPAAPPSLFGTPASRPRSLSACSTDSVCSDDSDASDPEDDADAESDSDMLHSPISPAETLSTCGTFSSCRSSRSSAFFSEPASPQSAASSASPSTPDRLARVQRPRGPRAPRPLPALPTTTTTRRADVPRIHVTVPSTPPLALRLKLSTPPPSYAEATQSALSPDATYPWHGVAPEPEPAEAKDDVIDWDSVEAYMLTCWDG